MKLAITGGAGFLGSHLCNRFAKKFSEIFVIDIAPLNTPECPANTKEHTAPVAPCTDFKSRTPDSKLSEPSARTPFRNKSLHNQDYPVATPEYFNIDIRDLKSLDKIFANADIVIHAAAALPLWKEKDIFSTNVEGTRCVLESAVKNGIKKVIFISSTAVYGIPEKHPVYENDELTGVGPYGESKIRAEKICEQYRQNGLCISIVRPKTFIGTGRLGVFQILYDWVKSGKRIPIIGNGKNAYQLLDVKDLLDAINLMLTLPDEKVNDTFVKPI